jgi:hypothetical protein
MLEECLRILLADLADRHDESFVDARPGLTNGVLDLRKRLLDEPTTVRLYIPASSSGHKIIASLRFDPLPMSMVSAG